MSKVKEWLRARWKRGAIVEWLCAYWGWVLAVGAVVVVAFYWRVDFACWIGYTATEGGLNPGARFFRDVVIGVAAITGIAIATWRTAAFDRQVKTAEDNLKLSEKRMLNERLTAAMELLIKENKDGSPAISTRVSGIHIMESLAKNAPLEFVEQVVKYLIAYIKGHAQLTATPVLEKGKTPDVLRMLGEDVKVAFAVLHNILSIKTIKDGIDDAILDFSYQDFSWLNLGYPHVNLRHYKKWTMANLTSSYLFYADLKGASFLGATLKGAKLHRAILTETNLSHSKMAGVNLWKSDLRGAKLNDADLSGSDLHWANLQGAKLIRTTFQDIWENEERASLEFARLDGARLEGVILRDARMHEACLRGVVILDFNSKSTDFRRVDLTKAHFGETCISCRDFPPAGLSGMKAAMDGKIWHSGADWAQGIKERPADAEWDLTQYKDGYALAGILDNFAKEKNEKFNSINLRKQARKLMDDGKLPKDMPQEWREWLANIDPATGLHSHESILYRAVLPTMALPPEQEEAPRTKRK